MKTFFFQSILILFVLTNITIAKSEPIVSSSSRKDNNGDLLIISGRDFGSHDLNIKWLGGSTGKIENSSTGTVPSNALGWYFNQGAGINPVITNADSHSGAKALYHGESINSALRLDLGRDIPPGGHLYVTWWVRFSYDAGGQWKMFRVNYQNDVTDDAPQFTLFNWTNSSDQMIVRPGPSTSSPDDVIDWSPPVPKVKNRWYRMEFDIAMSDLGVSNGSHTMTMYDPAGGSVATKTKTTMSYHSGAERYRWAIWQNYSGNGLTNFEAYADDHYVQFSRARVEKCDASTWSNRTHCEIQPPESWSANSIVVRENRGSFKVGDVAYLYIIDSDGKVSNSGKGFEIVVGESGVAGIPESISPPSDFIAMP